MLHLVHLMCIKFTKQSRWSLSYKYSCAERRGARLVPVPSCLSRALWIGWGSRQYIQVTKLIA